MARPKKKGLDYFPFDVNLFQDFKVRKLMRHQGGSQAIAVYTLLLSNIYANGYYLRWDEELPFFMSETLGLKEAYIIEVINYCAVVGLFDKELFDKERIITSRGIQQRYIYICNLSRRSCSIGEYSLISSKETPVSSKETPISSEKTPISSEKTPVSSAISTQRKEKKSKVNYPPQTPPGELRGGALTDFSFVFDPCPASIRGILSDNGVSEADVWEYIRLMTAPELSESAALSTVEAYANLSPPEKKEHPFYVTIQAFQRMEDRNQLHPMSYEDFQCRLFLHLNLLGSDQSTINAMISDPRMFDECKKLVAEIRRPGSSINQPAKYIIAGLRKLQSAINHQRLK